MLNHVLKEELIHPQQRLLVWDKVLDLARRRVLRRQLMQHEDSHSPTSDLTAQLRLIQELESGQWDSIECPQCHNHSVAAWFTNPAPREYRTWFVCSRCSFKARIQNSAQPRQFCS